MSDGANVKRILAMCRTKLDARTRQPWPDIQRRTAHIGNVAHDLKELAKALEHFHIVLSATDLVTLMNAFPTPHAVTEDGLAGFDFRTFANALYPPESLDLGPMGAQHAVLPFMGRHNPFIQPVGAAKPSVVPAGKVEPAHSGVAVEALSGRNGHGAANGNGNGAYVEAAPAGAGAAGHNSAAPQYDAPEPAAYAAAAASARPLTPHQHTQRHTQPLYAEEQYKTEEQQPRYAAATNVSGAKAKSTVLPAAQASQRLVAGKGKGAAPINVGAAGAGAGAARRAAAGLGTSSLPRRQSTGGFAANARATTSWTSSLKLHADANNDLNGTVGAAGMPTTGRQFLHTANFNRSFGGVAAQGKGATGKGAGAPLPDLPPAGTNADRLYAIATGRRSTGSLGLDSTGRVPAPSALTVTYNRRNHERRHEYTQRRPLTASQKRHTAYPIEEALPHGNYQHVAAPRFGMKQPGVVADPNFAKSIAAGVKWPGAWSHK